MKQHAQNEHRQKSTLASFISLFHEYHLLFYKHTTMVVIQCPRTRSAKKRAFTSLLTGPPNIVWTTVPAVIAAFV